MAGMVPAEGDRVARFEALFRAHYDAVGSFVRTHYPNVDGADIMSATFEIAWRRQDEIPAAAVRGWLIGVARNRCRNALRAGARRKVYVDAYEVLASRFTGSSSPAGSAEAADELRQALRLLRPADQEVLLLAAWEGLSGQNLGEALGVSASAAAVRLFRARERLRAAYEQIGGAQ